jgi:spermidine/putrescine-binding protein
MRKKLNLWRIAALILLAAVLYLSYHASEQNKTIDKLNEDLAVYAEYANDLCELANTQTELINLYIDDSSELALIDCI